MGDGFTPCIYPKEFTRMWRSLAFVALTCLALGPAGGRLIAAPAKSAPHATRPDRTIEVETFRFTAGTEDSMWSALYGAKSGRLYAGLSTHAEAAHFYEFDPAGDAMHHVADLTAFKGERGKAIRTSGKIHVRMGEDAEGNVYFGDFCEDTGPECVDPASYQGPHWFRYRPATRQLENLGSINRQWGLLGLVFEAKYQRVYGLAEDGHLYYYDLNTGRTTDLGRVDDWDICRTIFCDDEGNVYGSYPVGRVWKYDPAKDRIFDLVAARIPIDPRIPPRTMSNPMLDRKVVWRVIEWEPREKVAYGILCGDSLLFRFDPHSGAEGEITPLARLSAARYWNAHPRFVPVATLAMTITADRKLFYAPVLSVAFDYSGTSWDVADERKYTAQVTGETVPPQSVLVVYDLESGRREELGIMRTRDGRRVFGLGGAATGQKDGHLYFVGAVEETEPEFVVNKIDDRWPYSMALIRYRRPQQ